ncbi:hypothetical protein Snoj_25580 [Streptomyces nojiriensis]|uniref:Uncharacterized protein n=1 Tax=Streptomyces nojiriensis TaxID=66374 RepID=A0ABQ3SL99_9ACTN|nr:hypothetical protein [Streptomyces nojiriensis]QTI50234.1 hypothetical protein JYK04_08110 [Streptomyces nojiriensis]GGS29285.1 hypothetical protein GCM10010205_69170 [Streptomyces nojiriensis]GHI68640.1 hypothetical protein Snoj_25580 [Streptomyces nojiriensis]
MTEELPAGPAPESASRPIDRDDLSTLTAARQIVVDDHMFTASGLPGTFRLQLFTAPGARPVAVATQIGGQEGMGLMNGAESYAGAVWRRHCPDEDLPPVWVEWQLWPEGDSMASRFRHVVFAGADRCRPSGPRWRTITHEQLQDLVGAPVATDRGAGYVPRPAEPEPQLVFEKFAVTRLARPRPFREPECMPTGVPWWRRWTRQLLPRRAARVCCWYHGGDWHRVNEMALQVLRDARAQVVEAEAMQEFSVKYAASAGATDWETTALATLFSTCDAIQPDSEGGYINGQHRSQAMLEAGVPSTVVLRHVYDA